MQVIGIKSVIPLFTLSVSKTINFYRNIGFKVVNEDGLRFEGLDLQVNVYEAFNTKTKELVGNQSADIFFFSIQVKKIDDFKQLLKKNGISVEDFQNPPIGEYIYLRDPNGNRLCIYETYL